MSLCQLEPLSSHLPWQSSVPQAAAKLPILGQWWRQHCSAMLSAVVLAAAHASVSADELCPAHQLLS